MPPSSHRSDSVSSSTTSSSSSNQTRTTMDALAETLRNLEARLIYLETQCQLATNHASTAHHASHASSLRISTLEHNLSSFTNRAQTSPSPVLEPQTRSTTTTTFQSEIDQLRAELARSNQQREESDRLAHKFLTQLDDEHQSHTHLYPPPPPPSTQHTKPPQTGRAGDSQLIASGRNPTTTNPSVEESPSSSTAADPWWDDENIIMTLVGLVGSISGYVVLGPWGTLVGPAAVTAYLMSLAAMDRLDKFFDWLVSDNRTTGCGDGKQAPKAPPRYTP